MGDRLERILNGDGGLAGALARPPLDVAAALYGRIVARRNRRFDRGGSAVRRVNAPVISVGNITTGGTGKTPMVIDVLARLRALGRKPAVVSRGYRAEPGKLADELRLIRRALPEAPCVANPDRVAGAAEALAAHGADAIVLDDGFQHRRLGRDLDIVLIDATAPFGGGRLLPRGRLREPIDSLGRAHVVVLTRCDQVRAAALATIQDEVAQVAPQALRLRAVHRPARLETLSGEVAGALDAATGRAVYLLSGIGNPQAFANTVSALDARVCGHARFADHHAYASAELRAACTAAAQAGAEQVWVTEKDAVKLAEFGDAWPLPVRALAVRIDFCDDGGRMLDERLAAVIGGA